MIRLTDVSFHYPGTKKECLCQIDLSVKAGECVLITGKSGCGKTTLTRVLNGLCPKFYGGTLSGNYLLDGENVNDLPLDAIGKTLGSVFQDPRSQFFTKRVRDEIVLAMENHSIDRETMKARLKEITEHMGIERLLDREMQNLSSGEKQKVAIASVCAMRPQGLVLDEPSANLDATATEQLAHFLRRFKAEGHTIIVSEHRIHYLKDIFDRLILMEDGKIIREFSREEALALSPEQLVGMGLRLFDIPKLHTLGRFRDSGDMPVKARNISLRRNETQILKNVTIGIPKGEVTVVTGNNGAGKTTVCKILSGITREDRGAVYFDGAPTRRKKRIRSSFLVQQDVEYQLHTPSVREEILLGVKDTQSRYTLESVANGFGIAGLLDMHPNILSGGQKQRVLLAAATMREGALLVLDEPTSGLDGYHMRLTAKMLGQITVQGQSIVVITHDQELINLIADSLIYVHSGEIGYHRAIQRAKAGYDIEYMGLAELDGVQGGLKNTTDCIHATIY